MRILDGKGRVFGLINLIDLFVLALIAALAGSFIANLPLMTGGGRGRNVEEKLIRARFTILDQALESRKILQPGDKVLAGQATVLKVLSVVPVSARDVVSMDGRPAIYSNNVRSVTRNCSDVTVLIKAACVKLRGEYYCANVPIKVNSPISIASESYDLDKGVILDIDGRQDRNGHELPS